MKRQNEQHINELLKAFTKRPKIASKRNTALLKDAWKELMGPTIDSYTSSLNISKGQLTIRVNSAALRQELQLNEQLVINKINTFFGDTIVKDVVLR